MLRRLFPVLALSLSLAAPLAAQEEAPVLVEVDSLARVRVTQRATETHSPERFTGALVAAGRDSLVIGPDRMAGTLVLPVSAVERLEVSRGRRGVGRSALRGAKYGFLGGLAVSALFFVAVAVDDGDCGDCFISAEAAAAIGSVMVTSTATLVGGVVGALSPGERWVRVTVPVRIR